MYYINLSCINRNLQNFIELLTVMSGIRPCVYYFMVADYNNIYIYIYIYINDK